MNVLFVEDDLGMIDLFRTSVESWNEDNVANGRSLIIEVANSSDEAMKLLKSIKFDAAIIDLRLPDKDDSDENAKHGSELALSAIFSRGIPVAIVSGNLSELSSDVKKLKFIECFSKSKGYQPAIEWLSEQWGMMTTLSCAREKIEEAAAEVFSKRLWPQWEKISELTGRDQDELIHIVSRQYASHIADYFGVSSDGDLNWHPYENYVIPSVIEDRSHTGDLFELDGEVWVVLSPQCDMANGNIKNVLLAKCQKGPEEWTLNVEKLKTGTEKHKNSARKFFKKHIEQNISKKHHFLPPLPSESEAMLVDYSCLKTLLLDDLNSSLEKRVATISSPFLANLIQRFGSYISRTGQPNIGVDHFL